VTRLLTIAAAANPSIVTQGAQDSFNTVSAVLVTVGIFFVIYYYARKASGGKLMSKEEQDRASMEFLAQDNLRRFEDEHADVINRQHAERLLEEIQERDYERERTLEELAEDHSRAGRHDLAQHLEQHPEDYERYYGEEPETRET